MGEAASYWFGSTDRRGRFVATCRFRHAEEKRRKRDEGGKAQRHESCRIAETVHDFACDKTAHLRADALDGGDRPLSHVVMPRAAHEVREHERRERP
jgi:hypothetical protein